MSTLADLDTDTLWRMFEKQSLAVLRLGAMTEEQLHTSKDEKSNAPASGVALACHVFEATALELERRGELPEGWLRSDDCSA